MQLGWLVSQQEGSEGFPAAIGAGYSDPYAAQLLAVVALSGTNVARVGMPDDGSTGGINTGLLIGIGVAAVVVIAAVIFLLAWSKRR